MIKFDLKCDNDHIFEASFDDSDSFEKQRKKKLIDCPFCGSSKVFKSVMAPNLASKSNSIAKQKRNQEKVFANYNQKLKKYEWDSAEESLYEKKTTSQHERNCRKIWDSKKGKELRKHFIRTNGKIPIMYKAQLDPLFEV